jgi:hypothetical protein
MPTNDTIVDEPVTPAPLFAYRALKGILFGSPESPRDGDDSNKENAPLVNSEAPKKPATTEKSATGEKPGTSNNKGTTSKNTNPTKQVQSSENSDNMTIVFTTPKPKRWEGSLLGPNLPPAQGSPTKGSPTKGILRVPGQATPRAQSLRDINVTFKGLSPEEASKWSIVNELLIVLTSSKLLFASPSRSMICQHQGLLSHHFYVLLRRMESQQAESSPSALLLLLLLAQLRLKLKTQQLPPTLLMLVGPLPVVSLPKLSKPISSVLRKR